MTWGVFGSRTGSGTNATSATANSTAGSGSTHLVVAVFALSASANLGTITHPSAPWTKFFEYKDTGNVYPNLFAYWATGSAADPTLTWTNQVSAYCVDSISFTGGHLTNPIANASSTPVTENGVVTSITSESINTLTANALALAIFAGWRSSSSDSWSLDAALTAAGSLQRTGLALAVGYKALPGTTTGSYTSSLATAAYKKACFAASLRPKFLGSGGFHPPF